MCSRAAKAFLRVFILGSKKLGNTIGLGNTVRHWCHAGKLSNGKLKIENPRLNLLLFLLLAVCVSRLWLMPLPSSFWLDEMATAFVVQNGSSHPSLAVAPQVAATIYYLLPQGADALFGLSEVAYRLPSVLVMALVLFLIARLAACLIHPQAAWFAVFGCLALRGINYQAADARPYALGTCLAAASLLFLIRWLDSDGWGDALLFVLFAGLLWRVHLIYWPLYIVYFLYALVRLARGETRVGWVRPGVVFMLLGLVLLPVLLDALALLREASAHAFAPLPSFWDLQGSLKLGLLAVCGIGAWLLNLYPVWRSPLPAVARGALPAVARGALKVARSRTNRWFQRPPDAMTPSWTSLTLILGFWLCQPLSLFAYSGLTGNSVFLPRYLSVALPGAVLAATVVAGLYLSPSGWKRASLLLAVGVLLNLGQWRELWPRHDNSDWRAAVRQINELAPGPETPVICPSPFVEARPPAWRPDYPLPGFFYAHLAVYPIPGKPYLFPFESSPEAERFAMTLSEQTLASSGRFVIYGWDRQVRFWNAWFARQPELAGWRHRSLGPFGDIEVVVFEDGRDAGTRPLR